MSSKTQPARGLDRGSVQGTHSFLGRSRPEQPRFAHFQTSLTSLNSVLETKKIQLNLRPSGMQSSRDCTGAGGVSWASESSAAFDDSETCILEVLHNL